MVIMQALGLDDRGSNSGKLFNLSEVPPFPHLLNGNSKTATFYTLKPFQSWWQSPAKNAEKL